MGLDPIQESILEPADDGLSPKPSTPSPAPKPPATGGDSIPVSELTANVERLQLAPSAGRIVKETVQQGTLGHAFALAKQIRVVNKAFRAVAKAQRELEAAKITEKQTESENALASDKLNLAKHKPTSERGRDVAKLQKATVHKGEVYQELLANQRAAALEPNLAKRAKITKAIHRNLAELDRLSRSGRYFNTQIQEDIAAIKNEFGYADHGTHVAKPSWSTKISNQIRSAGRKLGRIMRASANKTEAGKWALQHRIDVNPLVEHRRTQAVETAKFIVEKSKAEARMAHLKLLLNTYRQDTSTHLLLTRAMSAFEFIHEYENPTSPDHIKELNKHLLVVLQPAVKEGLESQTDPVIRAHLDYILAKISYSLDPATRSIDELMAKAHALDVQIGIATLPDDRRRDSSVSDDIV